MATRFSILVLAEGRKGGHWKRDLQPIEFEILFIKCDNRQRLL